LDDFWLEGWYFSATLHLVLMPRGSGIRFRRCMEAASEKAVIHFKDQPREHLRLLDFSRVFPAVSCTTDDCQADPALVRRIGSGLGDLFGVFPDGVACRLCLR
jgi:hypothetical protein